MIARVIHPSDMGEAELARWREIVAQRDDLRSPYFAPEFALAVAQVRKDARVAIFEDAGRVVAFLTYHVGPFGFARPLALGLSDYQGLIAEPDAIAALDAGTLLRACRLRALAFDHMLASQSTFAPFHAHREGSPVMDLRGGYDAYASARRDAGSKQILKLGTLRRKLEREHAPLRFELHADPAIVLPTVFAWKSRQCVESGGIDVFAYAWTRALIERLAVAREPAFAGMLSALWLDDRLIAAHMGMRSDRVWHYWFPVYDHDLARYSPGLHLLLDMAQACESLGLVEIDLGKGEAEYKQRLASAEVPLAEGIAEAPGLTRRALGAFRRLDSWARRTRWARPATIPGRLARRLHRQRRFA